MMKKITYIMLSLSTVMSAQAFELSTMTLTYFDRDGEAPRRTSTSCNVVADCYSYSYQGIGTDIFFTQRLDPNSPLLLHGPWVGQDFGRAKVGGDSMPYGATTLGYTLIINQGRSRYYFGYGYGLSFASLSSKKFGLRSKTNTASASILGAEFSLFPYAQFVGLGLYLALKSSPDLPAVYAKDQTSNRQYYEMPISSSFGLILRF